MTGLVVGVEVAEEMLPRNLLSPNLCGHLDASRFGGRRESAAAQPE